MSLSVERIDEILHLLDICCGIWNSNRFFLQFFRLYDLKEYSLASFDVKIAAACLMIHCSAYSPACSGSEIVVEWSGTVVAVFDNAVSSWDWFSQRLICIGRCQSYQKSQHWNDFHFYDFLMWTKKIWYPRIFSDRII